MHNLFLIQLFLVLFNSGTPYRRGHSFFWNNNLNIVYDSSCTLGPMHPVMEPVAKDCSKNVFGNSLEFVA